MNDSQQGSPQESASAAVQDLSNMDTNIFAFNGEQLVLEGTLSEVLSKLNSLINQEAIGNTLFFDGSTGRQVDIDLRELQSTAGEAQAAAEAQQQTLAPQNVAEQAAVAAKPRGRPKLGVVGREVTLLPRHWAWLDTQRCGASAALRRLVDQERKEGAEVAQICAAQDSANRFMSAIAGNLAGFEEAVRALYARDRKRFEQETRPWPVDIRACARKFADSALV
jgi:hypothetical protein